jgi:hypothetical protein
VSLAKNLSIGLETNVMLESMVPLEKFPNRYLSRKRFSIYLIRRMPQFDLETKPNCLQQLGFLLIKFNLGLIWLPAVSN